MNTNGKSHRHIEDIERELAQERSHLSATLSALESRFSPGEMLDKALGYAKRNGGTFSDNLIRSVSHNPVPTLLAGLSVAWMAVRQGSGGSAHDDSDWDDDYYSSPASYGVDPAYRAHDGASTTHDTGDEGASMSDKAKDLGAKAGDRASAWGDQAKAKQHEFADRARQFEGDASRRAHRAARRFRRGADRYQDEGRAQFDRASQGAQNFYRENPLAIGVAAVAVGALIGASLPATAREQATLGKAGQRLRGKAESVTASATKKASDAGREGAEKLSQKLDEKT